MQVTCAKCSRVLDFVSERPLFCGFCGQPISGDSQERTEVYAPTTAPDTSVARATNGKETPPQCVGRYRLLRELGSGGMGTVYEAEDSASGRRVAVKLIAEDFTNSPDTVERFRQEGRLASAIAHPRCVFVLAADEDAGRPYIVMELMPGSTLKDLVERDGPLAPAQAIALILDVIDGLHEAHQNGVIHRDVKPSNCFLQADGRVKIGDFGLSKSLSSESHLTRTGTFLGTPLFASPEQVRGEAVDHQTDVYSVAATLYYLLTGKAPFQSGDAAVTLARLVTDPPPPMRTVRADLSAALDRVVLRGLERQRERRWRNLEGLRAALLPFMPSRLSIGGMGIRLAAYFLDLLVLMPVVMLLVLGTGTMDEYFQGNPRARVLPILCYFTYHGLLEGIWGCSLGKRFLRLRVCGTKNSEPPGVPRALLRTVLWYAFLHGASEIYSLLYGPRELAQNPFLALLSPLASLLGVLLILSTMRARNGYRGPHEFLSGTRVIQLPWPKKRRVFHSRDFDRSLVQPRGLPIQIGPFAVQGALAWGPSAKVLLAEDKSLGRKIWLWLRPQSEAPLPGARREVGRATRLRWLSSGTHDALQWDAFLASPGTLVQGLVERTGRLSWTDARPLLEQLAEELSAAASEGTLPTALTTHQVWVQPDGRLHLLDMPLAGDGGPAAPGEGAALRLLDEVSVLLLEGRPRPPDRTPGPPRAPVPRHFQENLQRLAGIGPPYEGAQQFHADLAATHELPTEVTRGRRAAHLGILAMFLLLGAGCCLAPVFSSPAQGGINKVTGRIRNCERLRVELEATASTELVVGMLNPAPMAQWCALGQWHSDKMLEERLGQELARARAEKEERLLIFRKSGRIEIGLMEETRQVPMFGSNVRGRVESMLAEAPSTEEYLHPMVAGALVCLVLLPGLAVIWSLLARGGFTFGMAGIALVRSDGGRPSRLRCAWRTLLFWLAPAGLALVSTLLDALFWLHWTPGSADFLALPLLSTITWWAAVALVPLYALFALLWPARSLHDRLAGTCLVPQ